MKFDPKLLALLPLLSKRLDALTRDDFTLIKTQLNLSVDVNDNTIAALKAMVAGKDVDTVSDLISKPDVLQALKSFVSPPAMQEDNEPPMLVRQCRHCKEFNLYALPVSN